MAHSGDIVYVLSTDSDDERGLRIFASARDAMDEWEIERNEVMDTMNLESFDEFEEYTQGRDYGYYLHAGYWGRVTAEEVA